MGFASTVDFANAARALSRSAAGLGLDAPSFRCPPRLLGADRTIRRRTTSANDVVVSVRIRGRPTPAVLGDMIEGVVAANRLVSPQADRARTELWSAVSGLVSGPASGPVPSSHSPDRSAA
jgi:hypothetical protein